MRYTLKVLDHSKKNCQNRSKKKQVTDLFLKYFDFGVFLTVILEHFSKKPIFETGEQIEHDISKTV